MDKSLFDKWRAAAKPSQALADEIEKLLTSFPDADMLLTSATRVAGKEWIPQRFAQVLKAQGLDTSTLEGLIASTAPAQAAVVLPPTTVPVSTPVVNPTQGVVPTSAPVSVPVNPVNSNPVPPVMPTQSSASTPTSNSNPNPVPPVMPRQTSAQPASAPKPPKVSLADRLKGITSKIKFKNPFKKGGASTSAAPARAPMSPADRKKMLTIAGFVVVAAVVVLGVVAMFYAGANGATEAGLDTGSAVPTEVAPQIVQPTVMDLKSAPWLGSLQIMFFLELAGVLISMMLDARVRKQMTDAVVPIIMSVVTIAVALPAGTIWWVALIIFALELALVVTVSVMGGRDFSPLTAYCLLVGGFGGLIFGHIGAVESFGVVASQVLPLTQLIVLMRLKDATALVFPLIVITFIIAGNVFAIIEGIRPSEDAKNTNPRWGTIAGGLIALVIYFAVHYWLVGSQGMAVDIAGVISYLMSFSVAIGISAASQNERVIQMANIKWGNRTIWDAALMYTSLILLYQVIWGYVGLIH